MISAHYRPRFSSHLLPPVCRICQYEKFMYVLTRKLQDTGPLSELFKSVKFENSISL